MENYFIWRQQDATRNAISMAAHAMLSHHSLQGLSTDEMQERLFTEKGINFNDLPLGLTLLLIVTSTLMLNSDKGTLTIAYPGGWLLLLVLSGLWLYSQRKYLD